MERIPQPSCPRLEPLPPSTLPSQARSTFSTHTQQHTYSDKRAHMILSNMLGLLLVQALVLGCTFVRANLIQIVCIPF